MTETNDEIELGFLHKKAEYYLETKEKVHLKYKNEGFKNGWIVKIKEEFFFFNDTRLGIMPVFFGELADIEKYEVRA